MARLNHPADLKYSETDEWIRIEGEYATIGITDYAQDQLGDIVYIELFCDVTSVVARKTKFGDLESVKATSELLSPISGEVIKVNQELKEHPELVNDSPYEDGWMLVVKMTHASDLESTMSVQEYEAHLQGR